VEAARLTRSALLLNQAEVHGGVAVGGVLVEDGVPLFDGVVGAAEGVEGEAQLDAFYEQWQHDRLVMDKWFGLQVAMAAPEATPAIATTLTEHSDFNWKNPNRFRAVMGALAMNHAGFHQPDGAGYALLADWLIRLDPVNPQTTARMCSAFQTWKRYDPDRQALMRAQLSRIAETPNLSRDTTEMVSRILGA